MAGLPLGHHGLHVHLQEGTSSQKSPALAELVFPPWGLAGQGFQVQGFSQTSRLAPPSTLPLFPPRWTLLTHPQY